MNELALIIEPDPDEIDAAGVYVEGTIGDRPYRFLLDTGAATSSVVADDITAAFPRAGEHKSSGVFAPSHNDLITVPRLTVGPIERAPFTLTRTPRDAPGISSLIGMDVLKDFCCHFLFDENRVLLDNDTAFGADAPRHDLIFDSKFHPYIMVTFEDGAQAQTVWDTGSANGSGHGVHRPASGAVHARRTFNWHGRDRDGSRDADVCHGRIGHGRRSVPGGAGGGRRSVARERDDRAAHGHDPGLQPNAARGLAVRLPARKMVRFGASDGVTRHHLASITRRDRACPTLGAPRPVPRGVVTIDMEHNGVIFARERHGS